MKLDQYSDNYQVLYKVSIGTNRDITGSGPKTEYVTKRHVRHMFQKFMQASPELWPLTRAEQINQVNTERRKLRKPVVSPEILVDLEISCTEDSSS